MSRRGSFSRSTKETDVAVTIDLDGGERRIDVPDGFLGHMLDAFATHGGIGLEVTASGDVHVDLHHTTEDLGIGLGEAVRDALGDGRGIVRFGHAYAPLDEALARAVIDYSGRGFFVHTSPDEVESSWVTREFPFVLVGDLFQAFADRGRLTLHLDVLRGRNPHHAAEATFKAAGLALRSAVRLRDGDSAVPSTKGTLDR